MNTSKKLDKNILHSAPWVFITINLHAEDSK